MLEINKIHNLNCLDGLKLLPDNSCDICITSPPYKEEDGYYENLIEYVSHQLYRVLKPNSLFFMNFGHLSEDKLRPFRACSIATCKGFKLNDTIIWVKNHFTPLNGKKHLNNLTEFIFLLYKGEMPDLDRLSIGVPYQDQSNAKRYNNGVNLRCGGNVWNIDIPTITNKSQRFHKDEFPLELPLRCLKLSGLKSGLVLEPFVGGGTTCIAAKSMNLNYIGFEKNQYFFERAQKRMENV